ncbi:hypothetical protein CPC08DRAFT_665093 [Agrocybe pediades]|nr:hypothetical protein CPC08DRAFT_665093 [Agrocybe pediades]
MAPREPTRAQLSSKLQYQQNTPAFLLKLQNRMKGIPDDYDDDEGRYDDEFEYVGEGREPIPRRPAIPERPADDPGSADEDDQFADEKPQVVVLKAGKHLSEFEAENIRRKEKGLPPLPDPNSVEAESSKSKDAPKESTSTTSKSANQGLSFSSSSKPVGATSKSNKRKAIGQLDELKAEVDSKSKGKDKSSSKGSSKKAKKESKTLLSFGDDT